MNKTQLLDNLKTLCELPGVSGNEKEIAKFVIQKAQKLGCHTHVDNLGNVIVDYQDRDPQKPTLLLMAHMDEVGFIVTEILESGLIKAQKLGGMIAQDLVSSRVKLISKDHEFPGTINAQAPHLKNVQKGEIDLYFDFGFANKNEVLAAQIRINDPIVFDVPFVFLNNKKRGLTKALDDRYGVSLGLTLLEEFKSQKTELAVNLVVSMSVQEEVGSNGATAIVNQVKPDLAIICDASPARDAFNETAVEGELGKGVLIRYFDPGELFYRPLLDWQMDICQKNKIPYQVYMSAGGTDGRLVNKALNGVLTLVHPICMRNIHGPSSLFDLDDYFHAYQALEAMVKDVNPSLIAYFKNGGIA